MQEILKTTIPAVVIAMAIIIAATLLPEAPETGRYQLIKADEKKHYLLDTQTGTTWEKYLTSTPAASWAKLQKD